MLTPDTQARHFAGQLVQPQSYPDAFLTAHCAVASELSFQGSIRFHVTVKLKRHHLEPQVHRV
jgi:hypothetical protein